jgi:hypothetical protein
VCIFLYQLGTSFARGICMASASEDIFDDVLQIPKGGEIGIQSVGYG